MTTLPSWTSSALQLSGSAYADCGNPSFLNRLSTYTIEAWVYLTTLSGSQAIVGKINNGVDGAFLLFVQDGKLGAWLPTNVYQCATPNPVLTANTWHHVAVTWNGPGKVAMWYLDGIFLAQFPVSGVIPVNNSAADVMVGGSLLAGTPRGWFFQGMVGEVMIWNVVRSAEQIIDDSVQINYQADTTVPALLMDLDFSSMPAVDWSGNNIQVTLLQGANYAVSSPGLYLQGNAYADCGGNADLSLAAGSYTVEGWCYPTAAGLGVIAGKLNNGVAGEYVLMYTQDSRAYAFRSNMVGTLSSSPYLTPNSWYHVAMTFNTQTGLLSLYINGNLQGARYVPVLPPSPGVNFLIGADLTYGMVSSFFQGYIQNVRVWNTCLPEDRIRQWMYNDPEIEPYLIAAFDFTVSPPTDSAGGHTIQLMNGAAFGLQTTTVASALAEANLGYVRPVNAEYYSPYKVPPGPLPTVAQLPADNKFAPFTDEFKAALWEDFRAANSDDADDGADEKARALFEEAYEKASESARRNPDLLKVFTVKEEGGMMTVIYHGVRGDTVVLIAPNDEFDGCTVWWIQFVALLTVGFLQALGLAPTYVNIGTRVYNMLSGNATVVAALKTLLGATVTVSAALGAIGAIYSAGYMWTILKMVFTGAGWWTLWWILSKVIAYATGAAAASLLAGFIAWSAQLTVLSLGFNAVCATTGGAETGELSPAPLAA
jgi:hypothetical protein